MRKREIRHGWVMGAISPVLGYDFGGASSGTILLMLGCDETGAI